MSDATDRFIAAHEARGHRVKPKAGGGWITTCSGHEDKKPSLSIDEGDDGRVVLKCFAGCETEHVVAGDGLEMKDLFSGNGHKPGRNGYRPSRPVAPSAPVTPSTEPTGPLVHPKHGTPTASWEIRYPDGSLFAIHPRFDVAPGKKEYPWFRNGTWGLGGVPLEDAPLYRSHLLAAEGPVVITEGEKACDALASAAPGLSVVATVTGAAGTPGPGPLEVLRGRNVTLWPDNELAGANHMAKVAEALKDVARSVRIIDVGPLNLPVHGDAVEWLADHDGAEDVTGLVLAMKMTETKDETSAEEPRVVTWPELLTKNYPPPVLLLAPWLETRTVNMIHGWRGCGKTRMAHGVAVSVSTGIEIIPGWQPRQTGRALIVDGELSGHELQKRISTLLLSYGIDTEDRLGFLIGRDYPRGLPSLDGPEGREMLERAIEKHKPDLLILDSSSTLLKTADENSSADWQPHQDYLLSLTYHGVSPLILHHDGKGGTQRGASKREDVLAESIGLKSPEDADETDGTRVLVTYGKHRNFYGREAIPFIAELIDGRWRADEPQENRLATASRLSAEGKSVRTIAEEMGLSKSAAGRLLARAKRDR